MTERVSWIDCSDGRTEPDPFLSSLSKHITSPIACAVELAQSMTSFTIAIEQLGKTVAQAKAEFDKWNWEEGPYGDA